MPANKMPSCEEVQVNPYDIHPPDKFHQLCLLWHIPSELRWEPLCPSIPCKHCDCTDMDVLADQVDSMEDPEGLLLSSDVSFGKIDPASLNLNVEEKRRLNARLQRRIRILSKRDRISVEKTERLLTQWKFPDDPTEEMIHRLKKMEEEYEDLAKTHSWGNFVESVGPEAKAFIESRSGTVFI
jgi:hypothetical protein